MQKGMFVGNKDIFSAGKQTLRGRFLKHWTEKNTFAQRTPNARFHNTDEGTMRNLHFLQKGKENHYHDKFSGEPPEWLPTWTKLHTSSWLTTHSHLCDQPRSFKLRDKHRANIASPQRRGVRKAISSCSILRSQCNTSKGKADEVLGKQKDTWRWDEVLTWNTKFHNVEFYSWQQCRNFSFVEVFSSGEGSNFILAGLPGLVIPCDLDPARIIISNWQSQQRVKNNTTILHESLLLLPRLCFSAWKFTATVRNLDINYPQLFFPGQHLLNKRVCSVHNWLWKTRWLLQSSFSCCKCCPSSDWFLRKLRLSTGTNWRICCWALWRKLFILTRFKWAAQELVGR